MKNIFTCLLLSLSALAVAQPNSIELKTSGGAFISSHTTIADAYAAIPASISNAYVIEITSSYNGSSEVFPIVFGVRTGSSAVNTITLRPAASVASVSITASKPGANVITIDDADYLVIDGRAGGTGTTRALTFGNTGTTSNSNTIALINGATNNVITYCNINNSTTGSAGRGISFGASASNTSGNSDNLVSFCNLPSGRYIINSSGTAANPNTRNRIYGCDVSNFYFAAIWAQSGTGKLYVDSCRLFHTINVSGESAIYGVLFDAQTDSAIITRNRIYDISNAGTGQIKGISLRTSSGTNYVYIYNNFFNLTGSTTSINVAAIEITASSATVTTNAGIFYNTIKIGGTLASGGSSGNVGSSGLLKTGSQTTIVLDVKNNIFVNERTGGASGLQHVALAITNTAGTINLDYNTYNSTSGNLVRYGSTVYTTFSSYQAAVPAGNEVNSNDEPIQFTSTSDLHLAGSSVGNQKLNAIPVNDIKTDIDNQVRGNVPYRGGDEVTTAPLPLVLTAFNAFKDVGNVRLNWSTEFENNSYGFDIERSFNSSDFTRIGFVQAAPNGSLNNTYSFTDQDALKNNKGKNLYYRLKIIDSDRRFRYSKTVLIKNNGQLDFVLNVYPNPVVDVAELQVVMEIAAIAELKIVSSNGQVLLQRSESLQRGNNIISLTEFHTLAKGNYFISVQTRDQKVVKHLVKL